MGRLDRHDGVCLVCRRREKVRNIDLYVIGSEGLNLCHDCEMIIVNFVQTLMGLTGRAEKAGYMRARKLEEKVGS